MAKRGEASAEGALQGEGGASIEGMQGGGGVTV